MTGVEQHVVVEPDDGSHGPLLRVADDRLTPGEPYGAHDHRAVDVVAVVLEGALTHAWGDGAAGWVELRRPDARLWLGPAEEPAPEGLVVTPEGSGTVVVWQLDAARPAWAD